ncbi:MAG: type I restriction enzyme HsdR N-terminal domain-containing protein [Cyclobacteriaceae bacterium]|nr:type I restriction enzyme HsdR N-terminal domain-containing protein [Cyclobacteriaceae bacterium]
MTFPKLNLPSYTFDISNKEDRLLIYDVFRKKQVVLTPEEWVRQNFLQFLIQEHQYPKSLIKVEGGLRYNSKQKRSDILVYTRNGTPFLLVECKSNTIKIGQQTFDQAAVYNQTIKAKYIVITNGLEHYCCQMDFDKNTYSFVEEVPKFI